MGRFGTLAWQRLHQKEPAAGFCLVDHDPQKLVLPGRSPGIQTVTAAAVDYLSAVLHKPAPPAWIIPAIPLHVAFEWLWRQRPPEEIWHAIPVPEALGSNLPYRYRGKEGELYLSLSTAPCPDDCPEPPTRCSLTGAPRAFNLYEYLENFILPGYTGLVIRSRQLAPGVGGYRPADLWQLRDQVLARQGQFIISTACRCHGVGHGLEKCMEPEAMGGI